MGDITCRICGEPWDAYGVYNGDMTEEEKQIFLKGLGCPCCKGKKQATEQTEEDFLFSLTDETDLDPFELLNNVEF